MKSENQAVPFPRIPNLSDYQTSSHSFTWKSVKEGLDGLPGGKGLNIAYEAVERHAKGKRKDTIAIRCIQKDKTGKDFTYHDLHQLSSRFANVLTNLGIQKSDRVFVLTGRLPVYIAAGYIKAAVFVRFLYLVLSRYFSGCIK
jgi:acetyl-CoA synthetase